MDKKTEKKLVLQGSFEDVIELNDHYYLVDKKNKMCVLPYTISTNGLLDKIGVMQDWNYLEEEKVLILINDYISADDSSDLVAANRILFEILGTNITQADLWMYLGSLFNNMSSHSPIKIYAVDITDIKIKADEDVEEKEDRRNFKLLDSSKVIQTDDILFLSAYLRLFNFFYVNSLQDEKEEKINK